MAVLQTSGTYNYSASVITLLTAALRITQVIGDVDTPSGAQLQSGLDAMAAMVKGWQASGIHVWCEEEAILFVQPGQILYNIGTGTTDHACLFDQLNQTTLAADVTAAATTATLTSTTGMAQGDYFGIQLDSGLNWWTTLASPPSGSTVFLTDAAPSAATSGNIVFDYATPLARPLKVMGGRRYNYQSQIDVSMNMWARLDYQAQPNKMTPGTMTAFFYDPQTGQGAYTNAKSQMNVWPNPSNNQFGMRFTAQRPIQDISTLANIPDFPVEWNAALKWNLAFEVGPENGVPMEQMAIIEKRASYWYSMAAQWDRESESLLFGVAREPGYRRG